MRIVLFALTAVLLSEPVSAQSPTSVTTELSVNKPCRIIKDDGEVGDYTLVRCPGVAGVRVYTEAGVSHVALSFRWGKVKSGDVISSYSLGDKLEWRGRKDKAGFKPYATILRMLVADYEADFGDDGRRKSYNVLAVIRMERRKACLMAVVDETTNPNAWELARATADMMPPDAECGKLEPKMVGKLSPWAKQALEKRALR